MQLLLKFIRSAGCALLAFVGLSIIGSTAAIADWPNRGIRLVVPFPPGGAPDALARLVADHLSASLSQKVVVENKPGAGGAIAGTQVARSAPDGYTLMLAGLSTHIINPLTNPLVSFDPMNDFTHIAFIGGPAMVLVSTPSTNIRTIQEFLREARAGTITSYTTLGPGTIGHLLMENVCVTNGLKLTAIPFTQVPVAEIITGRVPVGAFAWSAVSSQVKAGTINAFAIGAHSRIADYPEVLTLKEQGIDLSPSTWVSLAAPAGLDPAITQRLNKLVRDFVNLPEVQDRFARDASDIKQLDPEGMVALYKSETAAWQSIATSVNFRQ